MAKEKNKNKNKSIFGVIQFIFTVMNRHDKFLFVLLTMIYSISGVLLLLPAQVAAILVSIMSGKDTSLFGIPIASDTNIFVLILICGILALLPNLLFNMLNFFKWKFSLRVLMRVKTTAYSWATTPRKNLNLGMTIGDATYRINNSVGEIESVLTSYFDTILPQLFSAIVSAIYVCMLEIYSIPILATGCLVVFLVFKIRRKKEHPITKEMEKSNARITNFLVNSLGNLSIINIFKSENIERENLKKRTDDYQNVCKKRFRIWSWYWMVMYTLDALATYGIIAISATKVGSGGIEPSDIVLIISYVGKVFSPIQNFGWFLNTSSQLMTKITRLEELKPTKQNIIDTSKDKYLKPINKISLRDVCVINDDDTIIENINYSVEKGQLTVITGESGGGKTTSLRALIGIAEREKGDIIINDEYKVKSMYSFVDRMAIVMQSPFIFNRNVKENVYYPNTPVTDRTKEIINGLNMSKVINRTFDEDSEQEMEFKLSGGEKKRICVLRGLLQEKEIYVFDEPTNELDGVNCEKVLDYINDLKKNAIVMVVTHDSRLINKADKVVTINNAKKIIYDKNSSNQPA